MCFKKLRIIFIGIVLCFLLSSCRANNPVELFEKVLVNEQNIETVSKEISLNISSEGRTLFDFDFMFSENKKVKLLSGNLSCQIRDTTRNMQVLQDEGNIYFGNGQGKYFKVEVQPDFFDVNTYRQFLLLLLKEDESILNNLQFEETNDVKVVKLQFSAEQISKIFSNYVKPIILSSVGLGEDNKEDIVNQISIKLFQKFDNKINNTEVKDIVQEEMIKIDQSIKDLLENIEFTKAEYAAVFDRQNFLVEESLTIQARKDNKLFDIGYNYTAKDFNENIGLFISKPNEGNVTEVNSLSEVFILCEN